MTAHKTGSMVVAKRADRFATTGCLTILIALITLLGVLVSWLWYRHWHDGHVNTERRDRAFASILKQARATADDTTHALDTSGATDTDALIGVIWRHTQAPVITYDASRREFTARAARSAMYDEEVMLPGGGPVQVSRCLVFAYAHRSGQAWTSRVSEQDDDVCRPGTTIEGLVRLARTRISSLYVEDLTRAGVQEALDPTSRLRSYDVKSVMRRAETVTVTILLSSPGTSVDQCYRFTRPVAGDDGQGSATAVPVSSC